MSDLKNQDSKFIDFIFDGLDHGINSISDGGGPLTPFVMTHTGDKKQLTRFVDDKYEDALLMAEQNIKSLSPQPDYALIAFDGYITMENKKYDAILVRAFDKNQKEGLTFAQRYIAKANEVGIEPTGNAAFLGKETNLLSDNPVSSKENKTKSKKPWWKF